jgi:hypothetical protein
MAPDYRTDDVLFFEAYIFLWFSILWSHHKLM